MGNGPVRAIVTEIPINVKRLIIRKARRFNVIPRAERKIDDIISGKSERSPLPAPQKKIIENAIKQHPEAIGKLSGKHESLNQNLKQVYVKSVGKNKDGFKPYIVSVPLGGYTAIPKEDDSVPVGRFTLEEASNFLVAHQKKPNEFSVEALSSLLHINEDKMKNILTHVKIFNRISRQINKRSSWFDKIKEGYFPTMVLAEKQEDQQYQMLTAEYQSTSKYQKKTLEIEQQPQTSKLTNDSIRTERIEYYTNNRGPITQDLLYDAKKILRSEDIDLDIFREMAKKRCKELAAPEENKQIEAEKSQKAIEAGKFVNESKKIVRNV